MQNSKQQWEHGKQSLYPKNLNLFSCHSLDRRIVMLAETKGKHKSRHTLGKSRTFWYLRKKLHFQSLLQTAEEWEQQSTIAIALWENFHSILILLFLTPLLSHKCELDTKLENPIYKMNLFVLKCCSAGEKLQWYHWQSESAEYNHEDAQKQSGRIKISPEYEILREKSWFSRSKIQSWVNY